MDLVIVYDPAPGPASFDVSYVTTSAVDDTVNPTAEFLSLSLGAADANREIFVCIGTWDNTGPRDVSSVTVGGVSGSQVIEYVLSGISEAGTAGFGMWKAAVPTGTTGDVVVTFSGSVARCVVSIYRVINGQVISTLAATGTGSSGIDTITLSQNVLAGDAVIGGGTVGQQQGDSVTWVGLTEDYDDVAGNSRFSSAHEFNVTTASPRTMTFAASTSGQAQGIRAGAVVLRSN